MKRFIVSLLVIASLTFAPVAVADSGWSRTLAGTWITTDCATWWEEVDGTYAYDCTEFDNSAMSLRIGEGARPRVEMVDSFASACRKAGLPSRFVGVGYGEFTDPDDVNVTIWVTLTDMRCGSEPFGDEPYQFGLWQARSDNPAFDSLWDDQDGNGWGYTWFRGM